MKHRLISLMIAASLGVGLTALSGCSENRREEKTNTTNNVAVCKLDQNIEQSKLEKLNNL